MKDIIEMHQISKSFNGITALKSVDLQISEGEIFGLLGPSGAGKTTIIKILTGQLKPSSGEASVFGRNSYSLSDSEYAKIGLVLDNGGLYDRLSCYDNLRIFAQIFNVDKNNILQVLKDVDLLDAKRKQASALSKGMAQRLVLARAILHKPALLFLDEPTSGLDPATSEKIHDLLFDLSRNGTTIFLTTHDMDEASKLCDNISLLNEGVIIEYGSPESICSKYNEKQEIIIVCKDQTIIRLHNDKTSAPTIAKLLERENVDKIHTSEPNLETVFISLTGRKLI